MKFGIHNPSWLYGSDPAQAFEAVKAKAQWAENHGFVWFPVMDHLIQIPGVGAPDEPFMEDWTVLSALAAVTSRVCLATLATNNLCVARTTRWREAQAEMPGITAGQSN